MAFKLRNLAVLAFAAATAAACEGRLGIDNPNQPSLALVYGTATGIDGVMSSLWRTYHNNAQNAEGLNSQSKAFALESYGQVANFGMALRGGIPRVFINNQRGNQVTAGNVYHFNNFSRLMRTSAVATQSLDAFVLSGKTLGSAALDRRARAWGFFVNGIAIGSLALGYDSVAVATPQTPAATIPPLVGYMDALTVAQNMLDSAEAIATGGAGISPIDAAWTGTTGGWTQAQFVQVVRTFKARLAINVFRTPAEAAAAGNTYWTKVRDDAAAGITSDIVINLSGTTFDSDLDAGTFMTSPSWHQVSLVYLGVADTSGAYQSVFSQPALSARNGMSVLVLTPDRRWPSGDTRPLQSVDTLANGSPLAGQYLVNRPSSGDQPDLANPWGTSMYENRRWLQPAKNNGVGTWVFMSAAETRLIRAEAMLMLNDFAGASTQISTSRTASNLPAIALANGTDPVPGGAACVPRMLNGTCGNIWDALAYEKRMETQLTGFMQWFNDSRRWGDLPTGTALHWPVPNQEMDARNLPFYNMPATGTLAGAAGSAKYGV